MDDWGDYWYDDYGGGDDEIVTIAPVVVTPGEDDSNVGPGGDDDDVIGINYWENWDFPVNTGPDEDDDGNGGGWTAPDPTAQILASLNGYRPGWEKVSDSEYINRSTGETYNADTGKITTPRSSTNPGGTGGTGGTKTGGTNTGTGGGPGGGSGTSSGGSQSGGSQSTLDKALATLGSLVSAFTKVAGAVTGPGSTATAANAAAAAAEKAKKDAQIGKVLLAAGALGFFLWAKRKKS